VPIRLNAAQREKLAQLGGAQWVRDRIDKARIAETVAETMRKQLDVFADASGENRTPTPLGHGILSPRAK
jgi:hypothetical protein